MKRTIRSWLTIPRRLMALCLSFALILGAQVAIATTPNTLWSFATEGAIWASSTTVKGTTYVGSTDGSLYALDSASGELKWSFATEGPIYSKPSVSRNGLYINSDDGYVYKLNPKTGKLLWRANINLHEVVERLPIYADCCSWDFHSSSPSEYHGSVYVGSGDRHFYALNARNGKVQWSYETGAQVRSDPLVTRNLVVFAGFDGKVVALSKHGRLVWEHQTGGPIPSSPKEVNGVVVIGSRDSNLYGLSLKDGAVVWTKTYAGGSWVESSATVVKDKVYIGSSDWRVSIALNPIDGSSYWETNSLDGGNLAAPAVGCDAVYQSVFGYDPTFMPDGGMVKINRHTGEVVWTLVMPDLPDYVGHGATATPELYMGHLLFGSLDGTFYALEP
ncbi:PQQ-binding-like beta-propeller repeat protein [Teredinibacter waterburyi]|uniref:outer membrane protein assembly factor BamB family protein n=1 Tax=Teredinibacter waterburyi TaxID=1500538 RepID=UPI00165F9CC6|nr:PQQ-binding-like beta-propeller repeat protein [Teredinibacter waterburyi]